MLYQLNLPISELRLGYALVGLGKQEEAKKVWTEGIKYQGDVEIYLELQQCVAGKTVERKAETATTAITTKNSDGKSIPVLPERAADLNEVSKLLKDTG